MPTKHLGEFEQHLLLAMLHLEPDAYGATLRRLLRDRAGRSVSLGAIYSTVRRLETKGLVTVEDRPGPSGGRPRRYVRLTEDGLAALRDAWRSLGRLAAGLEGRLAPGA